MGFELSYLSLTLLYALAKMKADPLTELTERLKKLEAYSVSDKLEQVDAIVFCNETRENREDKKYLNSLYNPND